MVDFIADLGSLTLGSRFRRLSDRMMQQCGEIYRARDIDFQPGWFPLVQLLWKRGACSPSEATLLLGVTAASVSQVANDLVRHKLASSRKDRNDQRRRRLELTKKGKQLATDLEPLWEEIERIADQILADTGLDLEVLSLLEHAFDRGALREGVAQAEYHAPAEAPTIRTRSLILRPFHLDDVNEFQNLVSAREVSDSMVSLPEPFQRENLKRWVRSHRLDHARGSAFHFAVEHQEKQSLVGAVDLHELDMDHLQAEVSFWIGGSWWGRGFASEAVNAVTQFAFEDLGLNRLYAHHMVRNPASGRVLAKVGMKSEGVLRQRVRKNAVFEDVVLCAMLREDWDSQLSFK